MIHPDEPQKELLMDLEETLEGEGYIPLYDFAWTLRGYEIGLDAEQIERISQVVYAEVRERHPLRLVWSNWPIDLTNAQPVTADIKLDFDLDPEGSPRGRLLVLVPADPTGEKMD